MFLQPRQAKNCTSINTLIQRGLVLSTSAFIFFCLVFYLTDLILNHHQQISVTTQQIKPNFSGFLVWFPRKSTPVTAIWNLYHRFSSTSMADGSSVSDSANVFNLDSVRDSLIRQEDTIIFSLIERARFPDNSPLYNHTSNLVPGFSGSLVHFIVKETEAIQAKAGRYENPEENPFFPDDLPSSIIPTQNYSKILHPVADSININKIIWDMYFNQLLALFVAKGDDGNFAQTAAADLNCLQALSRRIHYGKYVAEVKFREAPKDYEPAIRAQDKDALMKLLTFEKVEEMVKKRVEKKAGVFGQEVGFGNNSTSEYYKVDPPIVSRLYDEWIMPLTKQVQVQYLLRRLD